MTTPKRPRILDVSKIVETIHGLQARIDQQFPGSGLAGVCGSLGQAARATSWRTAALSRPYWGLRLLAFIVVAAVLAAQIYIADHVDWSGIPGRTTPAELAQGLNAMVNLLLLAFAGLWFVLTLERRWKRQRVFAYLYEFRSLAHIIDMHQLTKDPTTVLSAGLPTVWRPEKKMSAPQLARYLDDCTEMLALIAKLAALYAERTQDREVTDAVNEIEDLTSQLGRKIWEKIMVLEQRRAAHPA